jgi:hypothetical protein
MLTPGTEDFAKVREILQQPPGPAPADNRRQARRIPLRAKLTVLISGRPDPIPIPVVSRDVSVSGIGFTSRRPFNVGERLVVRLQLQDLPSKMVLARVAYSRYDDGAMYRTGAEFLEWAVDQEGKLSDDWRTKLNEPII